jgi:hypothetical protein
MAAKVADQYGANYIALGYTAYQSGWLEQSPYAISRLSEVVSAANKTLLLPVIDLCTKDQAKHALRALNLSEDALEQKCARQQRNDLTLTDETMRAQIDRWADNLGHLLADRHRIEFHVVETRSLKVTV